MRRMNMKNDKEKLQVGKFTVQYPKALMMLGIGLSIVAGIVFFMSIIFRNETSHWILYLVFFSIFVVCIGIALEFIKKKVVVGEDTVLIRNWTGKTKVIEIGAITRIKPLLIGFRVYEGRKKIFELSGFEDSLSLFYLRFSDKMEEKVIYKRFKDVKAEEVEMQQELFVLRLPRVLVPIFIMATIIGMGNIMVLIYFFSLENGLSFLILISFMVAITLVSVHLLIRALRWRVRVNATMILIRSAFGGEKAYFINDITNVRVQKGYVEVYVREKLVVKFSYLIDNGKTLLSILESSMNN